MGLLNYALRYRDLGLHPIPIEHKGKRPLVDSWKKYQEVPPTDEDLSAWFGKDTNVNMAVVLGRGIIAVDLDGEGASELLRARGVSFPVGAPLSKTGNGNHVLLRTNEPIGDCVGLLTTSGSKPQVDIRGVGYIVVPPSVHSNGNKYEWLIPPSTSIPEAPGALLELIKSRKNPQDKLNGPGWVRAALDGVPEGQRDSTCARLAGYFLGKKIDSDTVKLILSTTFAKRCVPAFPESEVSKTVDSIAQKNGVVGEDRQINPIHIKEAAQDFYESLYDKPTVFAPTAFGELDRMLCGGFSPGDLIYMGARPGVGKTAMALQIAVASAKAGSGVIFISREMMNKALVRRMVSQTGRIDASLLRNSTMAKTSQDKIIKTLDEISKLPIWLTDELVSIQEATDMIAAAKSETNAGLLIVDHLQLMRSSSAIREKRLQVEAVSHGLKTLAMQFKIPVLCMSTLSRAADKKNPRPTLDSLRESGELEHDADIVLLLHRDFDSLTAECIVAKNRDGRTGVVDLNFESQFLYFSESEKAVEAKPSLFGGGLPYAEN